MQVDGPGQRQIAFTVQQRLASLMKSDQCRRAGRIHHHARPLQIIKIGQAIRRNARRRTRRRVRADGRQIIGHPVAIIGTGEADEDAATTPAQAENRDTGMGESLPAHLQQQTLLWVHGRRLARGNAKKTRIKAPHIPQRTRREGHRAPWMGA